MKAEDFFFMFITLIGDTKHFNITEGQNESTCSINLQEHLDKFCKFIF